MADESGERPSVSSRCQKYLKEAPFFCKIIEVLLCVISVGLIVDPFNSSKQLDLNHAGLVYVAICGYIMINAILIICYLYGERLGQKTGRMFVRVGMVLCFAAGVVLIHDWKTYDNNYISRYHEQYRDQMLASGIFAILASVVFAIEMYFLSKEEEEEK